MNGDIRPPRPAPGPSPVAPPPPAPVDASSVDMSLGPVSDLSAAPSPKGSGPKKRRSLLLWIIGGIIGLLTLMVAGGYGWYQYSLRPVDTGDKATILVTITQGMTPDQIADLLASKQLIHNAASFMLYTRLAGVQNTLQVGSYDLSRSMPLASIADILASGKTTQLTITFYPGATLRDPTDIADGKRTDVVTMLRRAGYTDTQIDTALEATYDHPLLADKPAGTSLEGYVYGETYTFARGTSVEDILRHTFDVYYEQLEEHNIPARIKQHGLSLYQGITLASIVQREVSGAEDQRHVAQVFYSRLAKGMTLGSDVTFIYAAQQQNQPPTVDFASPYNTRIHTGLPPGPIAAPGITALEAVANPASGDYLYFVAGDDGKTYFGRTEAEHEKNITAHCKKLCYE